MNERIIDRWIALTSALDSLYQACGEDSAHLYECAEIAAAESQLALVSEILRSPSQKFRFPVEAKHPLVAVAKSPLPAVMCQSVTIGTMVLAYHMTAKISMERTGTGYEGVISDFSFCGGRRIGESAEDLNEYKMLAQKSEKLDFLFGLDLAAKFIADK